MLSVLNVISSLHNCCEDAVFVKETDTIIYGGVFDGCSTGIKSYWASQTLAYAFSVHPEIVSDNTLYQVYHELRAIKTRLHLDHMNFLSTCILFQFDKKLKQLSIRVFGDGFYYINHVEYEIEQDNKPDYLGYYLDNVKAFGEYINKYPAKTYYDVKNFKICSDGIKSIEISQFVEQDGTDPIAILFHSPTSSNYLQRMWNILKRKHFTIADDLSIISYVQD